MTPQRMTTRQSLRHGLPKAAGAMAVISLLFALAVHSDRTEASNQAAERNSRTWAVQGVRCEDPSLRYSRKGGCTTPESKGATVRYRAEVEAACGLNPLTTYGPQDRVRHDAAGWWECVTEAYVAQ